MPDVRQLEKTARMTYQRACDGHATHDEAVEAVMRWLEARCPNTPSARLHQEVIGVRMAIEDDWSAAKVFVLLHLTAQTLEPSNLR